MGRGAEPSGGGLSWRESGVAEIRDSRHETCHSGSRISSLESRLDPKLAPHDSRPGRRLPLVVSEFHRGLVRGLDRNERETFLILFVDINKDR